MPITLRLWHPTICQLALEPGTRNEINKDHLILVNKLMNCFTFGKVDAFSLCDTAPVLSMMLLVGQCSVVQSRQIFRHVHFEFSHHIYSNVVQV